MKKVLTTLAAVMFVAVMSAGLSSCNNDPNGYKGKIVGEWKMVEFCENGNCRNVEADNQTKTYKNNGTFVEVGPDGIESKGKWKIDGEIMNVKYKGGHTGASRIEEVDGEKLVLAVAGAGGRVLKYKRM